MRHISGQQRKASSWNYGGDHSLRPR